MRLKQIEDELEERKKQVQTVQMNLESAEKEKAMLKQEYEMLAKREKIEHSEQDATLTKMKSKEKAMEEAIDNARKRFEMSTKRITQLERRQEEQQSRQVEEITRLKREADKREDEYKEQIRVAETSSESNRHEIEALRATIESLRKKNRAHHINELKDLKEKHAEERAHLDQQMDVEKLQISTLTQSLNDTQQSIKSLRERVLGLQIDKNNAVRQEEIMSSKMKSLKEAIKLEAARSNHVKTQLDLARERQGKIEEEKMEAVAKLSTSKEELEALHSQTNVTAGELAKAAAVVANLETVVSGIDDEFEFNRSKIRAHVSNLHQSHRRRRDMVDDASALLDAIRVVSENVRRLSQNLRQEHRRATQTEAQLKIKAACESRIFEVEKRKLRDLLRDREHHLEIAERRVKEEEGKCRKQARLLSQLSIQLEDSRRREEALRYKLRRIEGIQDYTTTLRDQAHAIESNIESDQTNETEPVLSRALDAEVKKRSHLKNMIHLTQYTASASHVRASMARKELLNQKTSTSELNRLSRVVSAENAMHSCTSVHRAAKIWQGKLSPQTQPQKSTELLHLERAMKTSRSPTKVASMTVNSVVSNTRTLDEKIREEALGPALNDWDLFARRWNKRS